MAGIRYLTPWLLICLLLLLAPVTSSAGESAGERDLTAAIQEQYQSIQSFRTQFTQELINASSQDSEVREGWIVYERPRRIHWETVSPEKEILILNRESVWDYFPAEGVAYRYSLRQMFDSKTMLRFISGEVDLSKEFHVRQLDSSSKNTELIRLELTPKDPDPSLVEAEIKVDPERMLIKRIKLIDFFGNKNILRFQNIELNCQPEEELFLLEPPEDTRIVDKTREGAPSGGTE